MINTLGFILFSLGSFIGLSLCIYIIIRYLRSKNPYIDFKD